MIRVAVANGCQSPLDLVIFPALKLDVIGVLGGFAFQEDLFEEQFGIIFWHPHRKERRDRDISTLSNRFVVSRVSFMFICA